MKLDVKEWINKVTSLITTSTGTVIFATGTDLATILTKKSGVVTFSFAWTGGINANGLTAIATLPAGFRPANTITASLNGYLVNMSQIHLQVEPSGTVSIINGSASSYADFFYSSVAWVL